MWAITGTGLVSSLGHGTAEAFAAYCRAESGLGPLRSFDPRPYRVRVAYEMPGAVPAPGRASTWLCDAIAQAVAQAGIAPDATRVPVLVGTGLAEQRSVELWWTDGTPLTLADLHFAGAVTRRFGPVRTMTFVNACSAGLYALAVGTDLLSLGEAAAVVVAATDSLTESMFGLLDRVTPEQPEEVRPFDEDRRGVLLGEGAAAVVVEPLAAAAGRRATVLALLRGVGLSCDAYHVTAPLRAGIRRAMVDSHVRSGVDAEQIDVVLAHGTGTVLNDLTEAQALGDVFGDAGRRPAVTSLKAMIGHTSGASGLMSLVTAVEAIAQCRVPPTLYHARTIPELAGFPVVTRTLAGGVRTAQVNAFGFGGVNAVAVVDRPDPRPQPGPAIVMPAATIVVTGLDLAAGDLSTVDDLLVTAAGGPPSDPVAVLGARGLRYKDRASVLALAAAVRALADAGLHTRPDPEGAACGVIVSSTLAVVDTVCQTAAALHADGVRGISPMDLPNASANAAAAAVAIRYGLSGLNLTVGSGPAGGLDAVYLAAAAIRAGRARRMLVVGVEPGGPAAHRLVRDTARGSGADPSSTRLFDGAAALVLEAVESAAERGAAVRAVVGGYGHDASLAAATSSALATAPDERPADPAEFVEPVGLWLLPCLAHPDTHRQVDAAGRHPALSGGPRRVDLAAVTGEAGGALGVVQCAAAVSWLSGRPGQRALVSSGGCWGESYASLTLRGDL